MDIMKVALTITCICYVCLCQAQDDRRYVVKGNQLYKKQDYENAAAEYKKAIEKNGKNAEAQYNLGNTLYKSRKPEEAQKAFEAAAETGDKNIKASSAYNKGVVFSRENKIAESIQAYKESLRQNPLDEQARENLQKALNEMRQQQPPPQPKQDKNKDKKQDNQPKEQPKNKSKLNQKQAEQMLNAVRQEEKKIQSQQKDKVRGSGQPEKDW
ncbi:tetratricopeptide repeat protein [Segetibacter sp. 3557_3]|uniref:tetratricopeptide repeat protein n=1 Tax=Segetibacter sp. 3557_3 TaxID=2547429 RepID=UPI0010586E91|nr:tetratricopeptide repeat protein [Segetibacter sp. 3557_3]TDH26237.1 tetratricopeptide repeat protein [Segetibacter sp. 3557_3]